MANLIGSAYHSQAGPYGKDGPPPSKFMSPLPTSHHNSQPNQRPPHSQRTNIAGSERCLPPVQRFQPKPTHLHQQRLDGSTVHHLTLPLNIARNLSPPKAAFTEPQSPRSIKSFDSGSSIGMTHGQFRPSTDGDPKDSSYFLSDAAIRTGDEKDGKVWQDLERAQRAPASSWLQKQSQTGKKFKTIVATVSCIVLIILAVSLYKVIKKPASYNSPSAFKWANGAAEVPKFAKNNGTASTNVATAAPVLSTSKARR